MQQSSSNYSDKLKDPRWQKKRLKILERDKWRCQICTSETDTLNVHHLEYTPGLMPWEYNDEELLTVCEHHHEFISTCKMPKALIMLWIENKDKFKLSLPSTDKYIVSEKMKELFRDFIIGSLSTAKRSIIDEMV